MRHIKLLFAAAITMFLMNGLVFAQDTTLTVTSDGNVGIGTTDPTQKLVVEGFLRVTGSNRLMLGGPFSAEYLYNPNGTSLRIHVGNDDRITIANGGKVGIGTTNPASRLHVHANGATKIDLSTSSTTEPIFQRFFHSTNIQGGAVGFDTDDNVLKLVHGGNFDTSTKGLAISSEGNVGIGTTSPTAKLHIGGTAGVDGIKFPDGTLQTTAATGGSGLWTASGSDIFYNSGKVGIGTTNPASRLDVIANGATRIDLRTSSTTEPIFHRFFHSTNLQGGAVGFDTDDNVLKLVHGGNFNTSTNGITIAAGGNVGIGVTSPSRKFHVQESSLDDIAMFRNTAAQGTGVLISMAGENSPTALRLKTTNAAGSTSGASIDFEGTRTGGVAFLASRISGFLTDPGSANDGALTFQTVGGGTLSEKMRIDGNGNVGIGTTSPNNPLEMASGAHVTAGGVWTNASSRQHKENISNLSQEEAISALEKLNPVKFNYKVQKDEEYVGFIAEDVPHLVATSDRKSLSPMDIVAVLTKVVQHQQKKIAELEARLNASQ